MNRSTDGPVGRIAVLALVGLVVAVAATGVAAAHTGDGGSHHHDGEMGSHGGTGWSMGWGVWFLWPALILLGGVAAYAILRQAGTSGGGSDDALTALRERYARGDIDDEEFERRRERLEDHG